MILDKIENIKNYLPTSCRSKILDFISEINDNIPEGEYSIDENNIFAKVQSYNLQANELSRVEAHRKYIDIQAVIKGCERIDVFDCSCLKNIETKYNAENDVIFYYPDEKLYSVAVRENNFAVLFPHEAHRPQMAVDNILFVKKYVIKVSIELWN